MIKHKDKKNIEKPSTVMNLIGTEEEEKKVSAASFIFFLNVHLDFVFEAGLSNGTRTGSKPSLSTSMMGDEEFCLI